MPQIGEFTRNRIGFSGRIITLTLDLEVAITPAEETETENAPDYRIMAGEDDTAFEVGAGWKRVGDKAGAYVAVLIDDPALMQPLRANLFQSDPRTHVLMWSRPSRREAKD